MTPEQEDLCTPPKRCRTAYNIFYQDERRRILDSIPNSVAKPKFSKGRKLHGKIGFQDLSRAISAAWKALAPPKKEKYMEIARKDKERYLREKEAWHEAVAELEREHSTQPPLVDYSQVGMTKKKATNNIIKVYGTESHSHSTASMSPVCHHTQTKSEGAPQNYYPLERPLPIPCNGFQPYSKLELKSLKNVSQKLDKASIDFLISRFA